MVLHKGTHRSSAICSLRELNCFICKVLASCFMITKPMSRSVHLNDTRSAKMRFFLTVNGETFRRRNVSPEDSDRLHRLSLTPLFQKLFCTCFIEFFQHKDPMPSNCAEATHCDLHRKENSSQDVLPIRLWFGRALVSPHPRTVFPTHNMYMHMLRFT